MNPWGLIPLGLGVALIWMGLMGNPLHLWSILTGAPDVQSGSGGSCPPGQVPVTAGGKTYCAAVQQG